MAHRDVRPGAREAGGPLPRGGGRRREVPLRRRRGETEPAAPERRWIARLEALGGPLRATEGRVIAFEVREGVASAVVLVDGGGRQEPAVSLKAIPARAWTPLLRALARKARFAASLLSGLLPAEVERLFSEAGHPLLPEAPAELHSSCTCGEEVCGHLAALHHRLDVELASDPLLVFRLRGRGREQLLTELTRHRGESEAGGEAAAAALSAAATTAASSAAAAGPSLPLEPLSPPLPGKPEAFFKTALPLASVRTALTATEPADAILTRLGPPPLEEPEAAELLAELHRAIGLGAKERLEEWEWRKIGERR